MPALALAAACSHKDQPAVADTALRQDLDLAAQARSGAMDSVSAIEQD